MLWAYCFGFFFFIKCKKRSGNKKLGEFCNPQERMNKKWKRVLLKLSGESLAGKDKVGINAEKLSAYAEEIAEASKKGFEIGIVIGGGNIFRGMQGASKGFDRVDGDTMGMLATMINSIALKGALHACGCSSTLFTAQPVSFVGEHFQVDLVRATLSEGGVAIFSGGTGNPFFTTDSAAALRAAEIKADCLLKGTRVDGVYTADPEKDPTAKKYDQISSQEVYDLGLKVMDLTATTLCIENEIPIVVFDMDTPGNLTKVLSGLPIGTLVTP